MQALCRESNYDARTFVCSIKEKGEVGEAFNQVLNMAPATIAKAVDVQIKLPYVMDWKY